MSKVAFWIIYFSRGLFFLLFLAAATPARSQSIAFWNVENLFDTISSPFYDDAEFTPPRWNTARYNTKIEKIASTLDEMAADIVGLAEVENEGVVRDLVMALGTDYNYIHLTSGDGRGIDQALLYKGDKFFPSSQRLERSGMSREFLHIEGELDGEQTHLIVCHLASNLNDTSLRERNMRALRSLLERILSEDAGARVVVMGDMNSTPGDKLVRKTLGSVESPYDFMHTPHWNDHRAGRGTYNFRERWLLYDWMMLSPALSRRGSVDAGVYAREYLTETFRGVKRPRRTMVGDNYLGGASDHFPVYIVFGN